MRVYVHMCEYMGISNTLYSALYGFSQKGHSGLCTLASAEFVPSTKEGSTYGWLYFPLLFFMEDVQLT